MITPLVTTASPGVPANTAPGAATPADASAAPDVVFASLLGAGIEKKDLPRLAGNETTHPKKSDDPATASDAIACDPAALLGAMVAGQAGLDARNAASGQATQATLDSADPPRQMSDAGAGSAAGSAITAALAPASARAVPAIPARAASAKDRPQVDQGVDIARPDDVKPWDAQRTALETKAPEPAPANVAAQVPGPSPAAEEPREQQAHKPEIAVPEAPVGTSSAAAAHAAPTPRPVLAPQALGHLEQLAHPLGTREWNDGLSNRVVWMARNDVQSASIHVNPPDLGPVEVRLTLTTDSASATSASVQFSAPHAATRDAIESALPRLHEMLRENGISLGNATVDSGGAGNANGSPDPGRRFSGDGVQRDHPGQLAADAAQQTGVTAVARRGNGLVDTFA